MQNWQKYLAELVATFIFIFICAGSVLANWQTGGSVGLLGIALASGLTLTAMIYSVFHISGGHLNPAVTIALLATGKIKPLNALGYVVSQMLGSVLAALLLKFIFANVSAQFYLGDVAIGAGVAPAMALITEAALTFFLVWSIYGAIVDKRAFAGFGPIAPGIILAVSILVAGSVSGAALNPVRSFGPAIVSVHWTNHWVYWAGPIAGGLLAAIAYQIGLLKKN